MTTSRGINRKSHRWTKRELATLRRRYPHERSQKIADDMGLRLAQVNATASNLGLHKSAAYLASPDACRLRRGDNVGASYRFPKGHVPANKGLRRPGYAPGRMASTQFKKGRLAHEARNYLPIGTQRLNADGYLERKVTDDPTIFPARRWVGVHRLLWEAAHGPIPPKHFVVFKDGNRKHVWIENLELITMGENARRNRMWTKYPKELADVLRLKGVINRMINKRLGKPERKEKNLERREASRRVVRNAIRAARQGKPDGHRAREGRGAGG